MKCKVSTQLKRTCGHEKKKSNYGLSEKEARHIYEGSKSHPAGVTSTAL